MTAQLSRRLRLGVFSALATAFMAGDATGQTTDHSVSSALLDVKTSVPASDVVFVTDDHRETVKAVLAGVSSNAIEIIVNGEVRTVAAGQVQRIQWQQRDSWLTGALIGAAIGAIPGIYYFVTDPNECVGLCPEEYALIGVGALAGGLVDWAIKKKVTVYERRAAGGAGCNLLVAPVVTRDYAALRVALRF